MLWIPREHFAALRGKGKYTQTTEIVSYKEILKQGTIIGIKIIIARKRANSESMPNT
jgi:hypothetical protein